MFKRKKYSLAAVLLLLILLIAGFFISTQFGGGDSIRGKAGGLPGMALASESPNGFSRATGSTQLTFPDDHGAHLDYQTEWWYYTGNLTAENGRRFGYQLTFFRRALLPSDQRKERSSEWAVEQVYMAHFALSDAGSGQHRAVEKFSRGSLGLAGAQAVPFRVWLEDWSIKQIAQGVYSMKASVSERNNGYIDGLDSNDFTIDLILEQVKQPVLHGASGYSRKGPDPGNASYYYSFTRLNTQGTVQVGRTSYRVSGWSWMDHEYSTSALASEQVGWDWFAIQLDGGYELMVFQIRREDGAVDPFSSGTWVKPDSSVVLLGKEDFRILERGEWRSQKSGAVYPIQRVIQVIPLDLVLELVPILEDQEMNLSYVYWEGAVRVVGSLQGSLVEGVGYMELTGYRKSIGGEF